MQESWSYIKNSGEFLKKLEILAKFQKEPPRLQQMLLSSIPTYLMGQVSKHSEKDIMKEKHLGYVLKN